MLLGLFWWPPNPAVAVAAPLRTAAEKALPRADVAPLPARAAEVAAGPAATPPSV